MQYNIGDIVIFRETKGKKYRWKLNNNEIYQIYDISKPLLNISDDKIFYGVLDKKGVVTTWFEYNDFITLKESRKQKIIKINESSL